MSLSGSSRPSNSPNPVRYSNAPRAPDETGPSRVKGALGNNGSSRVNGAHSGPLVEHSGRSSFGHGPTLVALNQKTAPKTGYEKWQETMRRGIGNPAWDTYDATLQKELEGYNKRFSNTPGYPKPDLKVLKAMLWTESGGPEGNSWGTRPMQIGNQGDAGYSTLKKGEDGSSLIMTKELKADLAKGDINNPDLNVRAGVAYLFTRMAKYETQSVVNPNDPKKYDYTVVKGDNGFDRIAKKVGSTRGLIQELNPGVKPESLQPGDVIRYQKGSTERVITGWRPFDSKTIHERYNARDKMYPQKLDYVLSLFSTLKKS